MAIWKIFRSCTKGIHSINITNNTRLTLDQQLINISIDTQLTLSAVCQKSAECGLIHMHQSKICYLNRLSTEMSIETESNDSQPQMTFVHIIQIFKLKQRHKQMNHAIFTHDGKKKKTQELCFKNKKINASLMEKDSPSITHQLFQSAT